MQRGLGPAGAQCKVATASYPLSLLDVVPRSTDVDGRHHDDTSALQRILKCTDRRRDARLSLRVMIPSFMAGLPVRTRFRAQSLQKQKHMIALPSSSRRASACSPSKQKQRALEYVKLR